MRVTSEMMVGQSLRRLSSRMNEYEKTQSRLATGKRMLTPSDDPAGANRAYTLRTAQAAREQELRNAADAEGWLNITDSQLQTAVERLHRVRNLTVSAASNRSTMELEAIATEIGAIKTELVGIANASHRGRHLFAGYHDGDAVIAPAGGATYTGDPGAILRRVGDREDVRINATADEIFWYGAAPGDNTFDLLERVQGFARAGDGAQLSAALGELDTALANLGDQQARLGAAANHVESAQRRGIDAQAAIRNELSKVEDVEFEEAVMDMQVQDMAYQATLQALARALPPSLVNFLR